MEKGRKHNYLVGFQGERQVVYASREGMEWLEPLTLAAARKMVKQLSKPKRIKRAIYKLVEVETID